MKRSNDKKKKKIALGPRRSSAWTRGVRLRTQRKTVKNHPLSTHVVGPKAYPRKSSSQRRFQTSRPASEMKLGHNVEHPALIGNHEKKFGVSHPVFTHEWLQIMGFSKFRRFSAPPSGKTTIDMVNRSTPMDSTFRVLQLCIYKFFRLGLPFSSYRVAKWPWSGLFAKSACFHYFLGHLAAKL